MSLVLIAMLELNLEGYMQKKVANTPFTITLNVSFNNFMLNFDVLSSIFGTLWIITKTW
jgi:hypothetical protein